MSPVINKSDRRFKRSEANIISSFIELVLEKGLQNTNIKDIADRADVGRGTFYQHYKDKEDLLNYIESKVHDDLIKIVSAKNESGSKDFVKEKVIRTFQYYEENIDVIRALFGPKGDVVFQKNMKAELYSYIYSDEIDFDNLSKHFSIPREYLELLNSAHYEVFLIWLEKENRESPKEIAEILSSLSILSRCWINEK